jgi:uncharacterized protein with FMN-binding domain
MTPLTKTTATAFALLTMAGTLAGCSAATGGSTPEDSTPTGPFTDGTYTETGSYQAPSGTESVKVTLTLKDDVITAVEVESLATNPQASLHQGEFVDGISDVVLGKKLTEIKVDKVGGSSLTSTGFNAAVKKIKVDAAE